ncbi:Brp/Blh family beta-carotene 15,15'-dioxygenase [Halorubrum sp. AD140]|uniref:Brp/Blh family beta-carotene 15,15'-dioxygenase n=1 Tax=Halorubrum sp. AD140 TaxID=3050073 RepID=UPI002ACC70C1|nr:Brp/Blh family beta-carotene 15,15'-dioxygenase [Halorubrum sp. AD140]MDZ5811561.1 Brp/Blh family beta-carotene 15,15'-dioxygenase [Halorubrum sp. AD140]
MHGSTEQTTSDSVERRLRRATIYPGWLALSGTTLLFALGVSIPYRYQFVPLAASVLLLGLPHGALDHLTLSRARDRRATGRSLAAIGGLYGLLGGLYAVGWFFAPVAGFAGFILLTLLHWGQGELHALLTSIGVEHLETARQRVATALARGTLPMLVPLVAFPDQYRLIATTLVGLFGTTDIGPLAVAFTPRGRVVVAAAVVALLAGTLALGYRRTSGPTGWAFDAGETALLVVFFATVPPILAIGLYFTLWHSLRHIGRLLALAPTARTALLDGDYRRAFGRFARDAAPLTAAAILILAGFYALVPATPATTVELVGLYLVFIAVLTLPHVAVVSLLDREQGVWTEPTPRLLERPGS